MVNLINYKTITAFVKILPPIAKLNCFHCQHHFLFQQKTHQEKEAQRSMSLKMSVKLQGTENQVLSLRPAYMQVLPLITSLSRQTQCTETFCILWNLQSPEKTNITQKDRKSSVWQTFNLNQYMFCFFVVVFFTQQWWYFSIIYVITFLYLSTEGILQEQLGSLPLSPSVQHQQPDMLTPPAPQLSKNSSS